MNPFSELPANFCTDFGVSDGEAAVNQLFSIFIPLKDSPWPCSQGALMRNFRESLMLVSIGCFLGETRHENFYGSGPESPTSPPQDSGLAAAK